MDNIIDPNSKSLEGYKQVAGIEGYWGDSGKLGLKIFFAGPPKFHEAFEFDPDKRDVPYVSLDPQDIIDQVLTVAAKRDPRTAERQLRVREEFENVFRAASLAPFHVRQIPNEYCSRHCCIGAPWFVITSKLGPIKIGWRKSVINLSWADSDVKAKGDELFKDQDVTKGDRYIHCWGYDKATAYLIRLKETLA